MTDAVCQWLNDDPDSPFHQLNGPSQPAKATSRSPVSRAALCEIIAGSLSSPYGALFPYRNIGGGETDVDGICRALHTFWAAVKSVFPEAGRSGRRDTRGAITEYLQDSFAQFCPRGWTCGREVPVLDSSLAELFGYASKADVLLEREDGQRRLWIEFEVSRADPVAT